MAPTPRPAGWKGGGEDFGFLRTFDGHVAPELTGMGDDPDDRFGFANVRWGFEKADLSGDYSTPFDVHLDYDEESEE
jgi:hypothetical protein